MKLNIYKLSTDSSISEFVENFMLKSSNHALISKEFSTRSTSFKVTILSYTNKSEEPQNVKWANLFKSINLIEESKLVNENNTETQLKIESFSPKFEDSINYRAFQTQSEPISSMLIIEMLTNGRFSKYLVPFGYGHASINKSHIDITMPLKFLSTIDIASINLSSIIQPFFKESKLLTSYKGLEDINFSIGQFLLSMTVTAKNLKNELINEFNDKLTNKEPDFKNIIEASNSLVIHSNTITNNNESYAVLHICEIVEAIESKINKDINDRYKTLELVDKEEWENLNRKVIDNYENIITYYEFFKFENGKVNTIEDFMNISVKNTKTNKEFTLGNDIFNLMINDAKENNIDFDEYFKKNNGIDSSNSKARKFNIFEYISCILEESEGNYLLTEGKWFKLNSSIIEELNSHLKIIERKIDDSNESLVTIKKIEDKHNQLKKNGPNSDKFQTFHYFEAQYNSTISDEPNHILLDRDNTKNSNVEVCDYAYKDEEDDYTISFVKCGLKNDGLSKNLNQAYTSLQLIINKDKEMLDFLKEKEIDVNKIKYIQLEFLVNKDIEKDFFSKNKNFTISKFLLSELYTLIKKADMDIKVKFTNVSAFKKEAKKLKLTKNLSAPK